MKNAFPALLIFLLATGSLRAELIAVEDFEDKTLTSLDGQGGGAGFTGTWSASIDDPTISVVAATLNYSSGAVSSSGGSKALQLSYSDGDIHDNDFSRAFSSSQSGTVYMSLLYREIVNPSFGTNFIQLGFENTSPDQPKASVLRRDAEYQVRAGTSSTTNGTQGSGIAADFDTHLLVLKAEKNESANYNRISMWVDPDSLSESPATVVANADTGLSTFALFTSRSAFHEPGDTFQIDNITIGTEWSNVVVPEPSTFALAVLGLLGLLSLGRRRAA